MDEVISREQNEQLLELERTRERALELASRETVEALRSAYHRSQIYRRTLVFER